MSASSHPDLAWPKGPPQAVRTRQRKADRAREDARENAKVKTRSGGRCEVWELPRQGVFQRCHRFAMPGVHHLICGWGKRNRGVSIKAEHKLAICQKCHRDIHDKILVPIGSEADRTTAATVRYQRWTR